MPNIIADRVQETTITTGTGTYNLDGAVTGYDGFVTGIADGNTCFYCAEDGTDWEVGQGTVTDAAPDTLSRDTILASSNAGAAVNWSAGEKNIFVINPASEIAKNTGDELTATTSVEGVVERSTSAENVTGTDDTVYPTVAGVTEIATQIDGIPAADLTANGPRTNTFQSGYSSTIMDLVYMGSGGKWLEADANAIGTSINMLGIALEAKTDTQAMNVALPGSFVRDDTWTWTKGVPLYVSGALGTIVATAPSSSGDVVRTVGFAVTAEVIWFQPSPDYATVV